MIKIDCASNKENIIFNKARKSEINSKIKDIFKNNIGKIIFFGALTLPMFFLAWPMAMVIISGEAKSEIESILASKRLNFIVKLSQKLPKHLDIDLRAFLKKESMDDFTEIFPQDTDLAYLVRLAEVFRDNKELLIQEDNEVVSLWVRLTQTEKKIKSYVLDTNQF